jgi:hypothetical protein
MKQLIIGAAAAAAIAGLTACSSPAPRLTSFQQCVQAYEQHPNETPIQVVPATPGCRVIPLGQAKIAALWDAARGDNPTTAKP